MGRTGHYSTVRGKRVFVTLRDGRHFIDRFVGRTDRFIILEALGKVPTAQMKRMSDYKPRGAGA